MAVSLRTRKNSTEPNWEQDLAPQVSKGKPGPANHWPEVAEVTLRHHHKRNTGNSVSAGVVGRHTGAVCESRITFMDAQLDTEPTRGLVRGRPQWREIATMDKGLRARCVARNLAKEIVMRMQHAAGCLLRAESAARPPA